MMKQCSECKEEMCDENFAWKNKSKGIKHSCCKVCQKKKSKAHYEANKKDYVNRARRQNKELNEYKRFYIANKKKSGCIYCGEDWQNALDLHHLDPDDKIDLVSLMPTKKAFHEELNKTIVLCSNCHRKYHSEHKEIIAFVSALASNELTQ